MLGGGMGASGCEGGHYSVREGGGGQVVVMVGII